MTTKLDTRPARILTSRECAKILGGIIGGLIDMASVEDVRTAIRWWAETEGAWEGFKMLGPLVGLGANVSREVPE